MSATSPINLKILAAWCRRMGLSLASGIDLLQILDREGSGHSRLQREMQEVRLRLMQGDTLREALDQCGGSFPPLLREMVEVGELSGHIAETFQQLADHYDHQLKMRRNFLTAIAWPVIQLVAAIGILSLVIWITGAFDLEIDMLGLGLRGTSGVLTFWAIIAAVGGGLYFLYRSFRNGAIWMRPVTELLPRIPWIGGCLRDFALARLTWAMHMTLETGMELKRALPLCLRSTQFEPYERHSNDIVLDVTQGREISEALAATGAFPEELIDSVRNGELAGRLPESMNILSLQYRDRAQQAMGVLTMIAGFAVWGMVAILLIVMIFRVFFQAYLGPIYENLPK